MIQGRSARRRIEAAVVAAVLAASSPALAHEEHHASPGGEAQILAPGYGPLEFTPPVPGTYALPPIGEAADGAVLRSDGSPARLHEIFGDRIVLLSFMYASCTDVDGCPLATAVLRRVKTRLRAEPGLARELALVSLSFDPERDTPELMRRYGEGFVGPGVDWAFLTTASRAQLEPLLAAYGQSLVREYGPDGSYLGSISHILRVFLIDRDKRIRNVYSVSFLHPDTLLNDVKTLSSESAAQQRRSVAADASAEVSGTPGLRGPGDYRAGYESPEYRTRSVRLSARSGAPADLIARLRRPPLGLPPFVSPPDNQLSREKVALGRKLFYDRRLSLNGTFSCAMCHIPEQGFTSNELATAVGIEGRTVRRNAPTLYNVAYLPRLFLDGRETRLEHQVWGPLLARNEMGNPSIGAVVEKLRSLPDYAGLFEAAFPGRGLGLETIGMALASYERTLVSGGSSFDRWFYAKEESALSPAEKRGFAVFAGKGGCTACHSVEAEHALFSDGGLHNTGIGYARSMGMRADGQRLLVAPGRYLALDPAVVAQVSERVPGDLGLYEITQDPADRWKYRTPSLRNVALTAPYMHDGSLATLDEVVAFYDGGGMANPLLDPAIRPLGLSELERADLVAFLRSLTGDDVEVLIRDAFAAPIGDPGGSTRSVATESPFTP